MTPTRIEFTLMSLSLAALVVVSAGCGETGDTEGNGRVVDDGPIEARIASAMETEFDMPFDVNCSDDGIEAGTDFSCIAYPADHHEDIARTLIETHLGTDGETIDPIDPESAPTSGPFSSP